MLKISFFGWGYGRGGTALRMRIFGLPSAESLKVESLCISPVSWA